MCDMAERVLNCQAGNGLAKGIGDWPEELESPLWTTAAGLAMYSARAQAAPARPRGAPAACWVWFCGRAMMTQKVQEVNEHGTRYIEILDSGRSGAQDADPCLRRRRRRLQRRGADARSRGWPGSSFAC